MAQFIPFRGVRYNQSKCENLFEVTTPPYDVISQAEQEEYYNMSPYNIIRLELGKDEIKDNEKNNRYTRAREYLRDWMQHDILVRDERPSFYLYAQSFDIEGRTLTRTGIVGLVKLQEFEEGVVLPHENTLSKAKEDRLNLLKATQSNFSQIFSLYNDEEGVISLILQNNIRGRNPDIDFTNRDGVREMMWLIQEPEAIHQIQQQLTDKKLFIADGHHRYETALNYRRELQKQNSHHTGQEDYNYVMMMLVEMDDPGLVVLPTHRIVKNMPNFDKGAFINTLSEYFKITEMIAETSEEIERLLSESPEHSFALYTGHGSKVYLLELKNLQAIDRLLSHYSNAYRHLDVTILQTLIFERVLGIDSQSLTHKDFLTYTRSIDEGKKWVDEASHQLAFYLKPTGIHEVKDVALAGEKMPQKSTYFYPKLHTGLVLNVHNG